MNRVNARMLPKYLNLLQKRYRVHVAEEKLNSVGEDPTFIKRIINIVTRRGLMNINCSTI